MKINTNLTIFNLKIKNFTFNIGWYKGSDYKLIQLQLFNIMDSNWIVLFCLEFLKFEIYISLDVNND